MTLREFSDVYFKWKSENTSMPYPKRDRFTDSIEKGLVLCIKAYCKMHDWEATVYDVKGHQNKEGKWMMSKLDKGRGDVLIHIKGTPAVPVWVEIKIGRDYQKEHQKKFQEDCIRRGVGYVIIKDWNGWWRWVSEI